MTDKKEVYCHACSVAGGAEMPVYHDEPACPSMNKPTDKHTELPWVLDKQRYKIYPANPKYNGAICWLPDFEYPNLQSEVNANYIIKACNAYPDLIKQRDELLESLKEVTNQFRHVYGVPEPAWIRNARNLINKIESVEDKNE